jgi:hypothetical protein
LEFELVEQPQAPDLISSMLPTDPRMFRRERPIPPRQSPDWRDQAILIPDQEYGS